MTDATNENPRDESTDGVFTGRRILICVCGGIAAYKSATVVSRLVQAGGEVTVAMTESATRFIAPLPFQSLSGRPVFTNQWDQLDGSDPQHIRFADRLDAALVAPCTMNTLARLAVGFAEDAVSTILARRLKAKGYHISQVCGCVFRTVCARV